LEGSTAAREAGSGGHPAPEVGGVLAELLQLRVCKYKPFNPVVVEAVERAGGGGGFGVAFVPGEFV
jgi:hypothetical protein